MPGDSRYSSRAPAPKRASAASFQEGWPKKFGPRRLATASALRLAPRLAPRLTLRLALRLALTSKIAPPGLGDCLVISAPASLG
jgi:hypothetical protein